MITFIRILSALLLVLILAMPADSFAQRKKKKKGGESKKEAKSTEQAEENAVLMKYHCETDVYYKWLPRKGSEDSESIEKVFFSQLDKEADSEEDAKELIKSNLPKERMLATKACERKHESRALCISKKLRSMAADYRFLDFAAQKALREAMVEECSLQEGRCLDTEETEPRCNATPVEKAPTEKETEAKS